MFLYFCLYLSQLFAFIACCIRKIISCVFDANLLHHNIQVPTLNSITALQQRPVLLCDHPSFATTPPLRPPLFCNHFSLISWVVLRGVLLYTYVQLGLLWKVVTSICDNNLTWNASGDSSAFLIPNTKRTNMWDNKCAPLLESNSLCCQWWNDESWPHHPTQQHVKNTLQDTLEGERRRGRQQKNLMDSLQERTKQGLPTLPRPYRPYHAQQNKHELAKNMWK